MQCTLIAAVQCTRQRDHFIRLLNGQMPSQSKCQGCLQSILLHPHNLQSKKGHAGRIIFIRCKGFVLALHASPALCHLQCRHIVVQPACKKGLAHCASIMFHFEPSALQHTAHSSCSTLSLRYRSTLCIHQAPCTL